MRTVQDEIEKSVIECRKVCILQMMMKNIILYVNKSCDIVKFLNFTKTGHDLFFFYKKENVMLGLNFQF